VLRELFAFSISERELNDDSDLNDDVEFLLLEISRKVSFNAFQLLMAFYIWQQWIIELFVLGKVS
jgi:hypothetical protein